MIVIDRNIYTLLLSFDCCEIFEHYQINEMHGLNCEDCTNYTNTKQNSYIAGWSNFDPHNDKRFVFINLLRCTNLITTIGLVMHELIHHSFYLHHYDIEKEEEVISWAENELYEIIDKILFYLNF